MEDYDNNELIELRKKLNEIQRDLKEGERFPDEGDLSGDVADKISALEGKIDELTKRQASSHKVLTVLQQQISGLKVGINNLEDLLEGDEEEKAAPRRKKVPPEKSSSKIFGFVAIFVIIIIGFIFANRWITTYMDSRWHDDTGDVPGIYESLESGQESKPFVTPGDRPYTEDLKSQIDEKLDDMIPGVDNQTQSAARDEMSTAQPERISQKPEVIEIFVPRVLILNGCGVSGIAGKLADYLTRNGIRVVDSKNADNFNYPSTVVYSTSDNPNDHIWLELIGVNAKTVKSLNQERDNANTVIILGKDYQKLSVY